MAEAGISDGTRSETDHETMQTPDWVTAGDLSGGGTLSREITTSIGGETTADETRASMNIVTATKSLKLTDPGKSTVKTTGVQFESDHEDARDRRRRAREDKLRLEQSRDRNGSKGTTRRTSGTIDSGEDSSHILGKYENSYTPHD